jgi:tRNA A-37 threonylcarbamoyl transferase component Bud32
MGGIPKGKGRMEADAPLDGAVLLGNRYVLGDVVGRGGMAQVYRAHDRVLGRTVAVKMMRAIVTGDADRARFTDEVRMLARLSHPGLVTVLDAATSDDEPYLVMELVDGPSLAECCRGVALEPQRVAAIGAQLADALGHVHAAGIVHRDLKPANVLLGTDGRAQLADFGLARIMSEAMRHTTTGATVGTPAYLAPEQVRGNEITPAVDVYSLGLVLIEALTGACPYQGLPVEAALARLTTPPVIPDALPRPWHVLLRAMTALDPADRPSTAEAADALRKLASASDSATAALRRFVVDRWHLVIGVTAGLLLVVLASAWYGGDTVDDRPERPVTVPQDSGGAVDDLRASRLDAHTVRNTSAPDGAAPLTSRSRNRADAPPGIMQVEAAETRDVVAPPDPTPAADQPQAAGGDRVVADGDAATEAADAPTVPPDSTGDDGAANGSGGSATQGNGGNGPKKAKGKTKDKERAVVNDTNAANGEGAAADHELP